MITGGGRVAKIEFYNVNMKIPILFLLVILVFVPSRTESLNKEQEDKFHNRNRRNSASTTNELMETLAKGDSNCAEEIDMLKKKYEQDTRKLQEDVDRANDGYHKQITDLQQRVKDMEAKVTKKEEEIDNIRNTSDSRIMELQRSLVEMESSYEKQTYLILMELGRSLNATYSAHALQQKVKDMEAKVAKKEEEIDNIRKSSLQTKMELQSKLKDLESHNEAKIRRIKKQLTFYLGALEKS